MSASIHDVPVSAPRSGMAWGPAIAGAVVATAITALLVALGTGAGFAAVSPLSGTNPSAMTFTVVAAIWLIVVQWISSFFGGYIAGRLRSAWVSVHTHEVTFRDTANGLVAWAVAALFTIMIAGSGASTLVSAAGKAVMTTASSAVTGAAASGGPSAYMLDTLFRPSQPNANATPADSKAEAGRILATAATGTISQPDHDYLVAMVAARTGLSQADAGQRVDGAITAEKQAVETAKKAADAARKAASALALYTGFSMLVGAFIAAVAGAVGGRQRDKNESLRSY